MRVAWSNQGTPAQRGHRGIIDPAEADLQIGQVDDLVAGGVRGRVAARAATVFPAPVSPVTAARPLVAIAYPIRAPASLWLAEADSQDTARERSKGSHSNPK